MSVHMVGLRQEQNPIMKFAVPFLKNARTLNFLESSIFIGFLCCLLRLSDLDLVLLPLKAKIWVQRVSEKVKIIILLLAIIQDKKPNSATSP